MTNCTNSVLHNSAKKIVWKNVSFKSRARIYSVSRLRLYYMIQRDILNSYPAGEASFTVCLHRMRSVRLTSSGVRPFFQSSASARMFCMSRDAFVKFHAGDGCQRYPSSIASFSHRFLVAVRFPSVVLPCVPRVSFSPLNLTILVLARMLRFTSRIEHRPVAALVTR